MSKTKSGRTGHRGQLKPLGKRLTKAQKAARLRKIQRRFDRLFFRLYGLPIAQAINGDLND